MAARRTFWIVCLYIDAETRQRNSFLIFKLPACKLQMTYCNLNSIQFNSIHFFKKQYSLYDV